MTSCYPSVCPSVSACNTSVVFFFQDDRLVNINRFSANWINALIVWRSGLGSLMGIFCQFLKLSAHHTIMVGYYHFMFLFDAQIR